MQSDLLSNGNKERICEEAKSMPATCKLGRPHVVQKFCEKKVDTFIVAHVTSLGKKLFAGRAMPVSAYRDACRKSLLWHTDAGEFNFRRRLFYVFFRGVLGRGRGGGRGGCTHLLLAIAF